MAEEDVSTVTSADELDSLDVADSCVLLDILPKLGSCNEVGCFLPHVLH